MRVAITGTRGLIGGALARSLETDGHDVLRDVRRDGGPGTTPFLDWAAPTLSEQLPAALQQLTVGKLTPEQFTSQIEGVTTDFADERSGG